MCIDLRDTGREGEREREKKRGGERDTQRDIEREISISCPFPPGLALTGDGTFNLGMCCDQESNPQSFGCVGWHFNPLSNLAMALCLIIECKKEHHFHKGKKLLLI